MGKSNRLDKRRKVFRKRSRLIRDLAESHLRSIHAFSLNWKLKHENYVLPKADGIFDFLEKEIRGIYSMKKDYVGASEWEEIYQDEFMLNENVQALLTTLNWIYWQRLEGYETADISAMREISFEDIGGIQQLYIAADALIEDYKSSFSFKLPYDFLSVFGLHTSMCVFFPFFISAPRYAKYGFFPSWILFSHEIAHVALDRIENQYTSWMKSKEYLIEDETKIKESAERIFSDLKSFLSSCEIKDKGSEFLVKIDEISNILENTEKHHDCCEFLSKYREIIEKWDDFVEKNKFSEIPAVEDLEASINKFNATVNAYRKHYEMPKEILQNLEGVGKKLEGSSEFERLEYFFNKWAEIRERALGIAELMMRLAGGKTGRRYLKRSMPLEPPHEEIARELICDIIATILSGEYYIYSFIFYNFLPTLMKTENAKIRPAMTDPMILRLFVCLETLRESVPALKELIDYLSMKYLYSPQILDSFGEEIIKYLKRKGVLKSTKPIPGLDMRIISRELLKTLDTRIENQKRMMEELLKQIMCEESKIRKCYLISQDLLKPGTEDRQVNRFFYIGSVLLEDLRLLLKEGSPSPEKFKKLAEEVTDTEASALKRLIYLVREYLIKEEGTFYNPSKGFKEIKQIEELSKYLGEGNIILNRKKYKGIESRYKTPKYIISAFCYLYFMDELTKDYPEFTFFKAFNSTILSMAWSKKALERFL